MKVKRSSGGCILLGELQAKVSCNLVEVYSTVHILRHLFTFTFMLIHAHSYGVSLMLTEAAQ